MIDELIQRLRTGRLQFGDSFLASGIIEDLRTSNEALSQIIAHGEDNGQVHHVFGMKLTEVAALRADAAQVRAISMTKATADLANACRQRDMEAACDALDRFEAALRADAALERAAQVAENFDGYGAMPVKWPSNIAAAIRALVAPAKGGE